MDTRVGLLSQRNRKPPVRSNKSAIESLGDLAAELHFLLSEMDSDHLTDDSETGFGGFRKDGERH